MSMFNMKSRALAHSLVAVVATLLIVANAWLAYSVDAFGAPFLFAGAILAETCLLLVFFYSVLRALGLPLRVLFSILLSAWDGIQTNAYVKRLHRTKSPLLQWVGRRLDPRQPTGLMLSVGVGVALFFLVNFMSVLWAVLTKDVLTKVDARVVNLMPMIRTSAQTEVFRFFTSLANTESVVFLMGLMAGVFWLRRKWLAAVLVIGVTFAEEACVLVLKYAVHRPRPDRALALVGEHDPSFPSGHTLAATVLFGLLAYFLYRSFRRPFARLLIALGYVLAVGLVGISRVYLGAHYPTDVLGSIYLGAALLALVITAIEVAQRTRFYGATPADFVSKALVWVVPALFCFALVGAPYFVRLGSVSAVPRYTVLPAITMQTVRQLPLQSETLTGKASEPISFVYVGSEDQIVQLFLAHGWYKADRSTLANTLKAVSVGFQGHQYLTAPVTPAYVATQPETVAFEQPTVVNTLRQRHHTRLWRTQFRLATGQEVWVATASFDESVELAGTLKLPTHRIAPDLDAERSYIIQSLGISSPYYLSVAQPQAGQNASGDIYFTDGRAAVVVL